MLGQGAFHVHEVERTIKRLKNQRAVATRYDERASVFHGTVTTAAILLRLRGGADLLCQSPRNHR